MKDFLIAAMPGEEAPAKRLAQAMGARSDAIRIHEFPDGENLVTAPAPTPCTAVYCSLDHPDPKFLPLVFAASALRDQGAREIILVAPYLGYMRQDKAFHAGEAVSQKIFCRLLSDAFDKTLTIDPHLHRTKSLDEVFGAGRARAASAAGLLADMIGAGAKGAPLLVVGPDEESAQWTQAVARRRGADWVVMTKTRAGDRQVSVMLPESAEVAGKRVCLVDDIASSGATLGEAAKLLLARGASSVDAFVVHALMNDAQLAALAEAGIRRIESTDAVRHKTNTGAVAPLLAHELKAMLGE